MNWDTDGRDWPNRAASSFVDAAGLRWHVQAMGSGPLLLLIHGTGASTHSWRELMPMLARDFRCIALDLPGHAFTAMPPFGQLSLAGMAHSVRALLASMRLMPELIVGHSAGAAIAAQMCLREQGIAPRSIVSLNGAFLPLPGLAGLVFPPVARIMAATPLAARLFAWRASDQDAVRRLIRGTGSVLDARGTQLYAQLVGNPMHADAALGMMARWDLSSLQRLLPQLTPRLHLVAGANDRAVSPEQSRRVQKLVRRTSFTLLGMAGHLAHEEKPREVAALVVKLACGDRILAR